MSCVQVPCLCPKCNPDNLDPEKLKELMERDFFDKADRDYEKERDFELTG